MDEQLVYIFADESCLGNQFAGSVRPGAAAGLIEQFDERRGWHRRDFARFDDDTTNNRMAIASGIEGLSALTRACSVVFTSDSQYLVRGMKEWVHGWAARGWRRKAGPIENLDLWKDLCRQAADHSVEWRWVRGHAGHPKNEYANDLAVRAATERRGIRGTADSEFDRWLEDQQNRNRFPDFLDVPDTRPFNPDRSPPGI
ncbi:MAG: RNase H family protein [Gemmatimonadota bacterium]